MHCKVLLPLVHSKFQESCSPDCPIPQFKQEGWKTASSSVPYFAGIETLLWEVQALV